MRALDRYEFMIRDGNLVLGTRYSVGKVEGTGANAKISASPSCSTLCACAMTMEKNTLLVSRTFDIKAAFFVCFA